MLMFAKFYGAGLAKSKVARMANKDLRRSHDVATAPDDSDIEDL